MTKIPGQVYLEQLAVSLVEANIGSIPFPYLIDIYIEIMPRFQRRKWQSSIPALLLLIGIIKKKSEELG